MADFYDHRFFTVVIGDRAITGWADATDAFQINPTNAKGTLVEGINDAIYVASNKNGRAVVLTLMQNHPDNGYLSSLSKAQDNPKTFAPLTGYAKDTVNKDEYTFTKGYILDEPAIVRGNGHNNMQWTITFAQHTKNLPD